MGSSSQYMIIKLDLWLTPFTMFKLKFFAYLNNLFTFAIAGKNNSWLIQL